MHRYMGGSFVLQLFVLLYHLLLHIGSRIIEYGHPMQLLEFDKEEEAVNVRSVACPFRWVNPI